MEKKNDNENYIKIIDMLSKIENRMDNYERKIVEIEKKEQEIKELEKEQENKSEKNDKNIEIHNKKENNKETLYEKNNDYIFIKTFIEEFSNTLGISKKTDTKSHNEKKSLNDRRKALNEKLTKRSGN